jgi:hypothetical protein
MRFVVEFTGKLQSGQTQPMTLAVDVTDAPKDAPPEALRELAWDAFKRKTGLRRWPGDKPPVITAKEPEAIAVEATADDSSGNREPGDGAGKLRKQARRG